MYQGDEEEPIDLAVVFQARIDIDTEYAINLEIKWMLTESKTNGISGAGKIRLQPILSTQRNLLLI